MSEDIEVQSSETDKVAKPLSEAYEEKAREVLDKYESLIADGANLRFLPDVANAYASLALLEYFKEKDARNKLRTD